jgi:glycosyltransferase involved in cell wall biosynthesis
MHVGVDTRPLLGALAGIGRYTFELSRRLVHTPGSTFSFYTPSPIGIEIMQSFGVGDFRAASSFNRLSKMVWSQTKLPHWANRDDINLFWGPTHRLPRFLSESIAKVVTIHDLVWKYAPQTMRPLSLLVEKRLMPEAIRMADLVLADSHSTASGVAETFPELAHKVRVVHLGVSKLPGSANPQILLSLKITKPYFLFVGTLEPRKNLDRLLQAFALVPESYRNKFLLVIAGGKGWGGVNLDNLISKYQLNDSVKLLGYVADHELAALCSNARFLAMPSIYEGFGLPLLEAMQYGTPVLTSHVGSMAEVAADAGMLIDTYSVESISLGIQRMLVDDEFIKVLGNKALRRSQDFSWDKCAAETMAVFEEAIVLRDHRMSRS